MDGSDLIRAKTAAGEQSTVPIKGRFAGITQCNCKKISHYLSVMAWINLHEIN
jgi:hypothetical protein